MNLYSDIMRTNKRSALYFTRLQILSAEVDILKLTITYHLHDLRTGQNMTVRELEEKSGVSKTQINDIENGRKHPTVYTLCLLSLALDVSPYDLFTFRPGVCPQ